MADLEQRVQQLAEADERHNRLVVALTDQLAEIPGVGDVTIVLDEPTHTIAGFTYHGRPYSLAVNETP